MKKILTLFLTLVLILSFQQSSQAYQGKWKQAIWAFDSGLYRFDYVELYKIFDKYKNKKISVDDCIIAGIKFLKENETEITNEPYDSKEALKIQHHSPMKFMAFVYANYTKLSPAALKELQSSLWDLTPYLNRSFTSREIELLTSVEKTIKFAATKDPTIKKRDLIDAFQKLVDNGYMTKAEAAVHILLIKKIAFGHPEALPMKCAIPFNEFWATLPNITGWIKDNIEEIKADKKAFRAIQIFLSDFDFELFHCIKSMETGFLMEEPESSSQNEYFIVRQTDPAIQPPPFPGDPSPTPKYYKEVFDLAKKIREYHCVDNKFSNIRKPIAWERGGGVYKNKLYIEIGVPDVEEGSAAPAGQTYMIYDKENRPVSAWIILDAEIIGTDIKNNRWFVTLFHEYFHTCQYSYTANASDNWYSTGSKEEVKFAVEATATLMEDMVINLHVKEGSYSPPNTLGTPRYAAEFLHNLDTGYMRKYHPYTLVTYFYYLLEKKCNMELYGQNGSLITPDLDSMDMMAWIWEEIEKKQSVFEAIRSYSYYGDGYLKFFHQFHIDNMLFNYGLGETYKGLKTKFSTDYTPFPEKDIKKIPYSHEAITITIDADSVCYRILYPPDNEPTFKKCVFVTANGFNKNLQTVSAIEIIDKGKENPSSNVKTLPIANDGSCSYELITQNGIIQKLPQKFDWTKVIFVFTNASNESVKAGIMCGAMAAKPDEVSAVYSRPKNLELSNLSGIEYKMMMAKIYINWKLSCFETEKDLLKLIAQTQPAPLPIIAAAGIGNQLLMNRIIEKYKQLNIAMQEGIVSAHDIRYQFYLRKNYIVSKICEGATSASVLAQLKRLKEYLDDINAVLSNAQNDKIISVIGAMVGDHALTQLTNIKNPMNTPWTDEEDKVNQSINSVKGKIQSVWKKSPYFFNSSDFGNAYTAVGNPAFEIVYQIGKQPAPVNIVPNLKNEPFAKDMVYTISSTVKNFTGVNYKEYLFSDTCDPMDLKYFSVIKKHDYREEFMPPEPGTPGYFKELNEIAYFRLNAHKCKYENIDLMPPDIIAAVSRKYEEFKRRTIDAIIIQFHKGKFDLLNSIKENVASIDARDELLTILTDALKEIKAAEVVNANAPNDICKITDLIDEITVMLR